MTAFHNDLLDPPPADLLGASPRNLAGEANADPNAPIDPERQEDFDDYRGV